MSRTNLTVAAVMLAVVASTTFAWADKPKVAVLELTAKEPVKKQEAEQLTDMVRNVAVKKLMGYDVITKENLVVLLKANNKKLGECEGECEVETGRMIGADVVVSGSVGVLGATFVVDLKVHSTTEGRLIDGQTGMAKTLDELIGVTQEAATRLLVKVPGGGSGDTGPLVPIGTQGTQGTDAGFKASTKVAIFISSEPSGAALSIDNRDMPKPTPYSDFLEPGTYSLRLSVPKYITKEEIIKVEKPKDGGQLRLNFKLEPNFGELRIETEPSGIAVLLNDDRAGVTPLTVREVPPGVQTVKLQKEGYFEVEQPIEIKRGETAKITHTMEMMLGGLQLMAVGPGGNQIEGKLFVDGKQVGAVPFVGELQVGSRRIRVESAAGVWEDTVSIPHRQTVEKHVEVKKEAPRVVHQPYVPPKARDMGKVLRYSRRVALPATVGLNLMGPLTANELPAWNGGPGFGTRDFRFWPRAFMDVGYDSNLYQGSKKRKDTTKTASVRVMPGFAAEYASDDFIARADAMASIDYFAKGNSPLFKGGGEKVRYGAQAGVLGDYAPADFVSLRAYDYFYRGLNPRNFTFENRYMRNSNRVGALIALEPEKDDDAINADLGIRVHYGYVFDSYDDIDRWNYAAHEFDWYLGLPMGKQFGWILDGKYTKLQYKKSDTGLIGGMQLTSGENFNIGCEPLLIYAGFAWAMAREVRFLAKLGYGWSFHDKGGNDAKEILWDMEFRFRFQPSFGMSLGYARVLDDSYYADHVVDDNVYLHTQMRFKANVQFSLDFDYHRPRYNKFSFTAIDTTGATAETLSPKKRQRRDHVASIRMELDYDFWRYLGANVGYEMEGRWSDSNIGYRDISAGGDPSTSPWVEVVGHDYLRHFVYAGVYGKF